MNGEEKFDFNNLFIFEMANNHQGSIDHGKRIISEVAKVAHSAGVRGAVKLQFRDLDTFIHPKFRNSDDNKHIPRFLSTRLRDDQFVELIEEVRRNNLLTMVTPFDEKSVDKIEQMGVEIIKIGSCSAQDWPLLERIAMAGKPVICSTGGLTIKDVDKIVSFFQKRSVHFALEHCVSIYPTPPEKFHFSQIELFRSRYPGVIIGFSTHESPENISAIQLAYAKGARIFEKHVGVPTDKIKLNAYSANPEQLNAWLNAYHEAVVACGFGGEREIPEDEKNDLESLVRGVFVKKSVAGGVAIQRGDVFFAFPIQAGQLSSGRWVDSLVANRTYQAGDALDEVVRSKKPTKKDIVYHNVHAVRGMLNRANIVLGHDFLVELSHHYGLDNFQKTGCTIVECFNREYAKKILVQTHGQWNPVHYHKVKDETFHVLDGTLEVEIDGRKKILEAGDTLWVPRGVPHGFGPVIGSDGVARGAIFEEISTSSINSDSFYTDRSIAKLPREIRKTKLLNWGRHQLEDIEEQDTSGSV
jgi:sialic acid synthase SpsE